MAFACSLEGKIERKIRADVKTILADGPVAERFLAALQITFASHARRDLGLAPGRITLDIVIDTGLVQTTIDLDRAAAGGPRFTVTPPPRGSGSGHGGDTLTVILTILRMHSVLDNATFLTRVRPVAMGKC